MKDEVVLSDIFKPSLFQDSPKPNYTLWLANVSENKVIQEFLSLPKSTLPPNEFNSHPYYSALQYYNYIHGKSSENTNKLTEQSMFILNCCYLNVVLDKINKRLIKEVL